LAEDIAVRRYNGSDNSRLIAQEAIVRGRVTSLGAIGDIKLSDRRVVFLSDPDAAIPAGKVALSSLLPLRTSDTGVSGNRGRNPQC
jgi:hypothetical protein